jgi:hypothetical protein
MTMGTTIITLLAILAQAAAPADDAANKAKAKKLLSEGTALYKRGDFASALEKFEAAYATFPSPKLWFNIGQANRDLVRPVEALAAFEKFLEFALDASPDTIADARASEAELRRKLGKLRIECPMNGAEISLDGRRVGTAPLPDAIWATPGRHQITATHASGAPAVQVVEVTAGTVTTVTVALAASAPVLAPAVTSPVALAEPPRTPAVDTTAKSAEAAAADTGWLWGRKWTWVVGGAAVVFAGTAGVIGGLAQSRFSDLKKSCGKDATSGPGCSESDIDALQTRMTTANVLFGLAGAAAVTAGILFLVEGHRVAVAPMAGETRGLLAEVRF